MRETMHMTDLINRVVPGRRFRYTRYDDYLCESVNETWEGVVISIDSEFDADTVTTVRLDTREKVTFYNDSFLCSRDFRDEVIILPAKITDISSLV
jgi:hypothetical protein